MRNVGLFAVAFVLSLPAIAPGQTVEGTVVDEKGTPIPGVDVTVYSAGTPNPISHMKTDSQGRYSLKPTGGAPLDVLYTHTKMESDFITLLSGNSGQNINRILYQKGSTSAAAVQSRIDALDRFVYLMAASPEGRRNDFVRSLADKGVAFDDEFRNLATIKYSNNDVGRYQQAKVAMIMRQYDILRR